jgi:hypothetical protein
VQHQQKSVDSTNNDEPLFHRDLKEIQSEALKNYNRQSSSQPATPPMPCVITESTTYESKRFDTMASSKLFIPIEGKREATGVSGSAPTSPSSGGMLSIFSRIVNVFKTPFNRKSQIKDNNPQPVAITSASLHQQHSKNEFKEFLINEQEDIIEHDVRVFTIDAQPDDACSKPGGTAIKPKMTKMSSGKTQQKDVTPKEVAKMRKSKTANDVNRSTSGWKCCLF